MGESSTMVLASRSIIRAIMQRIFSPPESTDAFLSTSSPEKSIFDAFIYLSGYFSSRDLPVPRILAVSPDRTAYVQEDLGDTCLLDRITDTALVAKTIDMLPRFQINGALGLDFSRCHPVPEMDMTSVMWWIRSR